MFGRYSDNPYTGYTTAPEAYVALDGETVPYNYNLTAYMGSAWLWDTFNFEKDTIYDVRTEVKNL